VITEIDPQGLAARADLQPGDIIVSINGEEIRTVADFKTAMKSSSLSKGIRLVIESQGMQRFALIKESPESEE
jgi:serine protease Do